MTFTESHCYCLSIYQGELGTKYAAEYVTLDIRLVIKFIKTGASYL
jgi:hypothetical protein